MSHIARAFAALLIATALAVPARAESGASASGSDDFTKPKPMDGVTLEAVETYAEPRTNEIGLGVGIYPFDAYYYGLSVNGGYTFHINRNFAWEVINAQYFYSFQKNLTTELADKYSVGPQTIPTLTYIVSTGGEYSFSYGKSVLFESFIRYFRTSALFGIGVVKRTDLNSASGNFGLKFEMFTSGRFSWKFEARDNVAVSGLSNYLTFILGTGLSF
ncbi:MAG: hypothetical protein P4M08_06795 [Oligoflexia bacterium]|nr:hypothetical protein [Oligoflexia bacterium]